MNLEQQNCREVGVDGWGGSDAPLQLTPIVLQNKKLHKSAAERNCHSDYGHRTK
jgi:hypothetical protein